MLGLSFLYYIHSRNIHSPSPRSLAHQDLLLCIKNIQEVGEMLRQPGRRFLGGDGKAGAATAIQAAWKGMIARRRHSKWVLRSIGRRGGGGDI